MPVDISQLKTLINSLPDPDERGLLSQIDKRTVDKVSGEIQKGGPAVLKALIDMLVEPGQGDDMKAHYALHCQAVYVCSLEGDQARRAFAEVLAAELTGDRPMGVKKYLVRQLQVAGGAESVAALGKLLFDNELCEPAAQALVAIGPGTTEQFRRALSGAGAKARLTIVQNLGVLGDRESTGALKKALSDKDREVRLAAAWGLANLGDAASCDDLLKAAAVKDGYECIKATDACLLLAEKLVAAGKKDQAATIYKHLIETRQDDTGHYIREAARSHLAAIS